MITTLAGAFGDEAVNNANEVLYALQGMKTVEQRIMDYYGITKADFTNTKKLKEAGVKHTPRLAELGVTKERFEGLFKDVLDFNTTDYGEQWGEDSTDSTDGLATESVVQNSGKKPGRPKA
jgi:hypothetical protein